MGSERDDAVRITQMVPVPPAEAFELWTSPEHVGRWWRPAPNARCTLCEIDLRLGGSYRLHLEYPDGKRDCRAWGEFVQIERPHRLVYTWNAETYEGNVYDTLVTVEFTPIDAGTEIRLTHEGLTGRARSGHRDGWGAMLGSFAAHRP